MACFSESTAGHCADRTHRSARRAGNKVFDKVRITLIAAAVLLLASPVFAADWRSDQPAQVDRSRIVSEIVVNGRPTPVDSYQAPANELQPVPSFALPDETNSVY